MASAPKSDGDCIESAYEDAVGGLFKQLFANLAGAGGTEGDQQFVQAFTNGLNILKRAKTLALGVVGTAPSANVAGVRAKRRRRS
jgi:hypothetical protein